VDGQLNDFWMAHALRPGKSNTAPEGVLAAHLQGTRNFIQHPAILPQKR